MNQKLEATDLLMPAGTMFLKVCASLCRTKKRCGTLHSPTAPFSPCPKSLSDNSPRVELLLLGCSLLNGQQHSNHRGRPLCCIPRQNYSPGACCVFLRQNPKAGP